MGIMIEIQLGSKFPKLWNEFLSTLQPNGIARSHMMKQFLKEKGIDATVEHGNPIGVVEIPKDQYMWMILKYQ
jgi:hypothetical protein